MIRKTSGSQVDLDILYYIWYWLLLKINGGSVILLISFTTLLIGQLFELKTKRISKILKTERGKFFFGSNLAFIITEVLLLTGIGFVMVILNIDQNLIVPISGLILGEIMLVIVNKQQLG